MGRTHQHEMKMINKDCMIESGMEKTYANVSTRNRSGDFTMHECKQKAQTEQCIKICNLWIRFFSEMAINLLVGDVQKQNKASRYEDMEERQM